LVAFAIVASVSLMVADRWAGAPVVVLQRFGPSLATFVLAIASVTSLPRLRIAAACIVAVTVVLMLQGAAAYHLGYNAGTLLIDHTTRGDGDDRSAKALAERWNAKASAERDDDWSAKASDAWSAKASAERDDE